MKTSDSFREAIKKHLDGVAGTDELFKAKYENPTKNIEDCVTYILNTVQKSGCNGFEDDEIYGMAMHYYDEANIEVGGKIDVQVVVNHTVELTEEEKVEAKQKALDDLVNEQKNKMRKGGVHKKPTVPTSKGEAEALTLF